jgi:acid stress-induced BolA-like protein IbaG/YrbA
MMHPEQVQKIIAEGLPCEHLQVAGDGHHFEALIVSAEFCRQESRAAAASASTRYCG